MKYLLTAFCLFLPSAVSAAPDYNQLILESIFPSGGQVGTEVRVTLSAREGGLKGADSVVIDGAPGISVSDITVSDRGEMEATFSIAADAEPGRRMVRVKGGATGLTSFRWFFVGPLPEHVEGRDNNSAEAAEQVTLPVVVNGVVNPTLDQDCFQFSAKAGQKPVIAVMSHWLDAIGYDRANMGFADLSLEVLDATGRVLAQASDTLGLDPLIHFEVPTDGEYIARVSGMGFKGFPQAVYRLTMGEVPYPVAVVPSGGLRGETLDVQFFGPNVPDGTRQTITVDDAPFAVQYVSLAGDAAGVHELPFIRSDLPGDVISSDAVSRELAKSVTLPVILDGRFEKPGKDVWCRLSLEKGEQVTLSIMAQRHLRSPVDTAIEIQNAEGERVAFNDDSQLFGSECSHDFVPFDSRLEFTAKDAGDYFVRVIEQSGTFGERAIFRLSLFLTEPDFRIYQWPDALPIWGPGSTAAFVVETHRMGGLTADVELAIEGLPEGWTGSVNRSLNHEYRLPPRPAFGQKTLLTITASPDVAPGTMAEFQVVGRAAMGDREVVHRAEALTLHMWQEPNRFRLSSIARAVVAPPYAFQIRALQKELSGKPGEKISIPIRIETPDGKRPKSLTGVSVNRGQVHFQCAFGPQVPLSGPGPEFSVPVTIPANTQPGIYGLTVADAWSSETRKGIPGPCTELIQLTVAAP